MASSSVPPDYRTLIAASARKPAAGHASRILVLVGTAALASIFMGEMLVGRFVLDGASPAVAIALLVLEGPAGQRSLA
jgi:hypothetical protein